VNVIVTDQSNLPEDVHVSSLPIYFYSSQYYSIIHAPPRNMELHPRLSVNNHDRVAHCRKSLAMVKEILQPLKPEVCPITGEDFW
jgi:hypothetical protein